jgi:hypothetical protein
MRTAPRPRSSACRTASAHILRRGDLRAAGLKDEVAGDQSLARALAVGIDVDNGDAPVGADLRAGSERQSETTGGLVLRLGLGRALGCRLLVGGRHARKGDLDIDDILVAPDLDGDVVARVQAADAPRQVAGVVHRLAVDRQDHVAGHDPGFPGRTGVDQVGDDRAFRRRCRR